jgi:hypothetical protein
MTLQRYKSEREFAFLFTGQPKMARYEVLRLLAALVAQDDIKKESGWLGRR